MPSRSEFHVTSVGDSLFVFVNSLRTLRFGGADWSGSSYRHLKRAQTPPGRGTIICAKGELGLFAAKDPMSRKERLPFATRPQKVGSSPWLFANRRALWRYARVAAIRKPYERIQDVTARHDARQLFAAKDGNRA